MVEAGFHSFAKLRAQIFNPAMADRGMLSADCHNKMAALLIAKVQSLHLRADCHRPKPPAGFVLGLMAGVGHPQHD
jgi:hypothetical protein